VRITYPQYAAEALVTLYAKRIYSTQYYIVFYSLSVFTIFFVLSLKQKDGCKKLFNPKRVSFSLNFCLQHVLLEAEFNLIKTVK